MTTASNISSTKRTALFSHLFIICGFLCLVGRVVGKTTEREILNRLLDPAIYDPSIRPGVDTEETVIVGVDLDIKSLGPLNDIDMEFSVGFFFRQEWRDERLQYTDINTSIIIGHMRLGNLWVPDLYFPHSTMENMHHVTTPNVLIRLSPSGTIMYSQRISLTLRCQMDLLQFPMDTQTCEIDIESYSFNTDQIRLAWSTDRNATYLQPDANIPDFFLIGTSVSDCTKAYAVAAIHLRRLLGFYAIQTYVPSILIVILSWASFWIDHEAVPARISVGLLTVLTITTQSSGARSQLPRVPYVKAIDTWMSACLVFVFTAYMEYAVVTVLSRRFKKTRDRENKYTEKVPNLNSYLNNNNNNNDDNDEEEKNDTIDPGRYVDKLSRALFPSTFVVFNLVYWIYYNYI